MVIQRFLGVVERLCSRPRFQFHLVLIVFIFSLPALGVGFQIDDYFQQLAFIDRDCFPGFHRDSSELFTFVSGDAVEMNVFRERGILPWWSGEKLTASFWRPISVFTHQFDYFLWPDRAWLMHLHSIVWYVGIVVLVCLFYSQTIGDGWIAGLAALMFVFDDAHGWPVGWIANRNSLIALFFGLCSLRSHHRWRSSRQFLPGILSVSIFCVSLFAGESALGVTGYLCAYAIFLERGPWTGRIASLLPYAAVTVLWQTAYQVQGYGTKGLGLYIDPGAETGLFLETLLHRVPILLAAQFGGSPAFLDIMIKPPWDFYYWLAAVVFLIVASSIMVPWLRGDRRAGFFATGMVLSTIPISATFPHERLLLFTGLGGMGLISLFIEQWLKREQSASRRWFSGLPTRALLVFFILLHMLLPPIMFPLAVMSPSLFGDMMDDLFRGLEEFSDSDAGELVLINSPMIFLSSYYAVRQCVEGRPVPETVRILAPSESPVTIERIDERTLLITPRTGFLSTPMDDLFRSTSHVFREGDTIHLRGLTITVISMNEEKRPLTVSFRFDTALDDANRLWFWYDGRAKTNRPWQVPGIGETVILPAASYLYL